MSEEMNEEFNENLDVNENANGDGVDDNNGQDNPENVYIGAPDNYDYTNLKLPEGIKIDDSLAEEFSPIAKELNLSQQGVNKLCDFFAQYQQKSLEGADEKIAEFKKIEKAKTKAEYEKLLNTDKEIGGGDSDKMNSYLDTADIGYDAFATKELKAVLSEYSLDYHPAVIKLFYRLGKLCGQDKIIHSNTPSGSKVDAAEVLYGGN